MTEPKLPEAGQDFENYILFLPDDRASTFAQTLATYETVAQDGAAPIRAVDESLQPATGYSPPPPESLIGSSIALPRRAASDLRKYSRFELCLSECNSVWSAIDVVLAIPRGQRFMAGRGFVVVPAAEVPDFRVRWSRSTAPEDESAVALGPYLGGAAWDGPRQAREALATMAKVLAAPPAKSALVVFSWRVSAPT